MARYLLCGLTLLAWLAAPAPCRAAEDPARGAVDPYDPIGERAKFFAAAGPDSELSAEEFATARQAGNAWPRPFDTWQAVAAFDKDRGGTIDWFEADAYRRDLARRAVTQFDADGSGRLEAPERAKLNALLTAGRAPTGAADTAGPGAGATDGGHAKPGATPGWGQPASPAAGAAKGNAPRTGRRDRLSRTQFDTDGDGTLSREERKAWAQARKAARARARQEMVARFDTDGDGKLNDAERDSARQAAIEQRRRQIEAALLRKHDADGDGHLTPQEQAAYDQALAKRRRAAAAWRDRAERMRQRALERYDADGDGQLSDQERQTMQDTHRRSRAAMQSYLRRHADADGDGQATRAEIGAYLKQLSQQADTDGDGTVSAEERRAAFEAFRQRAMDAHDQPPAGP